MLRDSDQADLLARTPRCDHPDQGRRRLADALTDYDVAPGDDAGMRRRKWVLRALTIYVWPCSTFPAGKVGDCPRCGASFLRALDEPPEGPWAP
jgi:hypothetical protein